MAAGNAIQTPPFLSKLYQLVSDPQTSTLVSWTDEKGLSFTVHKPSEFGRDILPRYFKHNNFSSFVRQLNQYGFHKQNPDKWMFGHDSFRKDRPDLLKSITRRRPKQTTPTSNAVLPHTLSPNAIVELGNYGIEGEVKALKRDKDLLIQELVVTRRNEEQLRNKCSSLEHRVTNLENSSKQMQTFIMHYFSQVLQPYSQAMAPRKRKRLPPSSPSLDSVGVTPQPSKSTVANVPNSPPNASVDALRAMIQQMGVGMSASPSAPRTNTTNNSIVERQTNGRGFAPATIQELPQDDQINGRTSIGRRRKQIPRIGPPVANGSATNRAHGRANPRTASRQKSQQPRQEPTPSPTLRMPQLDLQSPSPSNTPNGTPLLGTTPFSTPQGTHALANAMADAHQIGKTLDNGIPDNHVQDESESALDFLSHLPNTPGSSMTMDLIDTMLDGSGDLEANGAATFGTNTGTNVTNDDINNPDYDVSFSANQANGLNSPMCTTSKDDERAIEEFLELSGDDQPLPPPLMHLPEGTDIHALATRIEGFAHAGDE